MPRWRQLTDGPSWDEQAIFTPDMKDVIFMSSRDQPGLLQHLGADSADAGAAQGLRLPADPAAVRGRLSAAGRARSTPTCTSSTSRTGSVRRLTTDGEDGWITPEFSWDPKNRFLMWTENRFPDGYRYPFPPNASEYAQSLQELLQNPPVPGPDVSPNGVGVAALPLQQRTQIGVFSPK